MKLACHKTQREEYLDAAFEKIVLDEGNCWLWPSVNGRGYGYFGKRRAHRVVYEMFRGQIPRGKVLDHTCQNTRCVNPWHLDAVTQIINCRRRKDAKLNHVKAAEIRASTEGAVALARRYGVSRQTIHRVRTGGSWA